MLVLCLAGLSYEEVKLGWVSLFRCFAELAEVIDQPLEVFGGMYAESVPDISQYHYAAKAQVLGQLNAVQVYPAQCHHLAVYNLCALQLFQHGLGEMGGVALL